MRKLLLIIVLALVGCSSSDDSENESYACDCSFVYIKEFQGPLRLESLRLCEIEENFNVDIDYDNYDHPYVMSLTVEEASIYSRNWGCD